MTTVSVEVLRATKGPLNIANRTAVDVENSLKRNVESAEQAIVSHRKRAEAVNQQLHLFVVLLDKLGHWRQTLEGRAAPAAARIGTPRSSEMDPLATKFVQPVSAARDRELSSLRRAMDSIDGNCVKINALRDRLNSSLQRVRAEIQSLEDICRRDTHAFTITLGRSASTRCAAGGSPRGGRDQTPDIDAAYLPFLNHTNASAASGGAQQDPSAIKSPRRSTTPRESSMGSAFASNWETKVAATASAVFDALHESTALQKVVEDDCRRLQVECNLQHNVAVNVMNTAIDARNSSRNAIIADIRSIEQRVFELRKEWRNISDAALAMREPLATATVRQTMRDVESDAVDSKLSIQREETTAARSEVKKRCKVLHDEVKRLEAQYLSKQAELNAIDGIRTAVPAEGTQAPVQHPLMSSVPLTQKSAKCEKIRTFPDLQQLTRPFAMGIEGEQATKVRARTFYPLLNVDGSLHPASGSPNIPRPPQRN
jgi:hypothetical protein